MFQVRHYPHLSWPTTYQVAQTAPNQTSHARAASGAVRCPFHEAMAIQVATISRNRNAPSVPEKYSSVRAGPTSWTAGVLSRNDQVPRWISSAPYDGSYKTRLLRSTRFQREACVVVEVLVMETLDADQRNCALGSRGLACGVVSLEKTSDPI